MKRNEASIIWDDIIWHNLKYRHYNYYAQDACGCTSLFKTKPKLYKIHGNYIWDIPWYKSWFGLFDCGLQLTMCDTDSAENVTLLKEDAWCVRR